MLAFHLLGNMLAAAPPPSPSVVGVEVFRQNESPYFCVKIPELLQLESGVLLAFGEARMFSCGDYTATDLVVKRSTTGRGQPMRPVQPMRPLASSV